MQFSIIPFSVIGQRHDFRIDSEYYQPNYLALDQILAEKSSVELRELTTKISDGTHFTPIYQEIGIPFLSALNIRENELYLNSNFKNISLAEHQLLYKRCDPKENDILLRKVGVGPRWACVVPAGLPEFSIFVSVAQIRCKPDLLNRYYLSTFINTRYGQEQLIRFNKGISQPDLHLEDIRRLLIPKLSLDFQQTVERLYVLRNYAIIRSLQAYGEAEHFLSSQLNLSDWQPIQKLSFIENYLNTQAVGRVDAEYFQPKYEELMVSAKSIGSHDLLGNIVSIKKCMEPGSEAYQESGVPFIRVSNLSKFGINDDNQQFISNELYNQLKCHQPKRGEILLSKDGSPGIACYLIDKPPKMIPSGGIVRLAINEDVEINPEYLTLVLNSLVVQKQIERDIGGSVIDHWLVGQINNCVIPLLPLASQKFISAKVSNSFSNLSLSKQLLKIAKKSVEMAIETNETQSEAWIKEELAVYA